MITNNILITDFSNKVFQEMFKKYFSEIKIEVKDWDGLWAEMNSQNDGNTAFIRTCNNEPAGFIQFTTITLENWFFKERSGFLREIWVDEKFRKQGNGTELLRLAEKYFKDNGISRIFLTTEEDNIGFYLNRGYQIHENIQAKNQLTVMVRNI